MTSRPASASRTAAARTPGRWPRQASASSPRAAAYACGGVGRVDRPAGARLGAERENDVFEAWRIGAGGGAGHRRRSCGGDRARSSGARRALDSPRRRAAGTGSVRRGRADAVEADRRQQVLFVMVVQGVDPARAVQDPVRGDGDPARPARDAGADPQAFAHRQSSRVAATGAITVWESLAVIEYVAELYPEKAIWPRGKAARAHARSLAAEMHAGFQALRQHCPMNFRRPARKIALTEAVEADVARIEAAWAHARKTFGKAGPFLFGRFSAADAMYAPVVNRFHVYDIPVSRADARLHGGGDGAAGVEGVGRRRRGGRMAHRKIRRDLARAFAWLTRGPEPAARARAHDRRRTHHRRGARARPVEGFLPQRDGGELAGVLRRDRRRLRRSQLGVRQSLRAGPRPDRQREVRQLLRPVLLQRRDEFDRRLRRHASANLLRPHGRDRRRIHRAWC